ncbi:MAG: DUF4105 domain-containing protein [Bacteriovoracia bacterium]
MAKDLLILFVIILMSASGNAIAFDIEAEAAKEEWLGRLLFVDGKSLVQNQDFFLSQNGHLDALQELRATVKLIRKGDFSFACKFPGRFAYLAPKFGINPASIACENFRLWRESFEADGLSIMFASQYLENPASSFGHTYLKINSKKKSLYLNKVISFAATVPKEVGAAEYVWKGLMGGFPGIFNESPFYVLFQEYANMERRDIWEYELNLDSEETSQILAILFEVIHFAKFDYLFLTDNCSSLLIRLIDIVAKKLFHASLPTYVIPIETVKVLDKKGMLKQTIYHPSITSRMVQQSEAMSAAEVHDFMMYVEKNRPLSRDSTAKSLDLGLEYLNFQRQKHGGVLPDKKKRDFDQYLFLRAKETNLARKVEYKVLDPIKTSHPRRFSLGAMGVNDSPVGFAIQYRPLGRDFYDRPNGFAKESEVNFFKTMLYLDPAQTKDSWFTVDLIGIRKFSDYNSITKDLSWGANLSAGNQIREKCLSCYYSELDSHVGVGKSLWKDRMTGYVVFHPTVRVGNIAHKYNFLPQVEAGIINSSEKFVFKVAAFHGLVYDGYDKSSFNKSKTSLSWIISNEFSFNMDYEHFLHGAAWNSWMSGFSYYF